ncbi:MAG: DUF4065 domain-containing protein [Pseudonocardia sp.]|nr:DUF4065 domain-containing protein [Pseudonocardia sp.]
MSTSYSDRVQLSAHAVAAALRARQPDIGAVKLHKLLYYCQGHHLATFGTPLFHEPISAWDMGPVIGTLWRAEKEGESHPIDAHLPEVALNTIGYVLSRYGALSSRDLVHLTHSEDPWQKADVDRPAGQSAPISESWMAEYFRAEPGDDGADTVLDAAAVADWLSDAATTKDTPGTRDTPEDLAARIDDLRARPAHRAER